MKVRNCDRGKREDWIPACAGMAGWPAPLRRGVGMVYDASVGRCVRLYEVNQTWIPACAGMTNGRGNDIWGRGIGMEGEWWAVPTLQEWQAGGWLIYGTQYKKGGREDGFPPARE